MKETTGEFSMTVVTIIAIIAIATLIGLLREPIKDFIEDKWGTLTGNEDFAFPEEE